MTMDRIVMIGLLVSTMKANQDMRKYSPRNSMNPPSPVNRYAIPRISVASTAASGAILRIISSARKNAAMGMPRRRVAVVVVEKGFGSVFSPAVAGVCWGSRSMVLASPFLWLVGCG